MQGSQTNYEFILNDQPKSGGHGPLPKLSLPAMIIAVVIVLMILIAIAGSLLGGKKTKVGSLVDVIGASQEISRVSATETPQLKDANLVAVSVTVQNTMASDQAQLKKYANDHKIKIDTKKLATYANKSTDETLAGAAANNYLDSAFKSYLNSALNDYQQSLSTAYNNSSDQGVRAILQASYQSNKVLLDSSELKIGS